MTARKPAPDVRAYRKGDTKNTAELARTDSLVLAVDPGANGIALLFTPIKGWPGFSGECRLRPPPPQSLFPLDGFGGLSDLAMIKASANGHLTVVIEDSFAGGRANPAADTALARSAGSVIGALCALLPPGFPGMTFDVVFVMEKTWFGVVATSGNTIKRDQRKHMSATFTVNALGGDAVAEASTRAGTREAFCDAYAMAAWWGRFVTTVRADPCGTK